MGWLSRQSKGQSLQTTIRSAINPWSRATLKCQPSKETLWCKKPDLESRRDAICNKKDQRTDAKIQLMNNCLHAYDKSVPHIQAHKGLQSVFNVHLDSKTFESAHENIWAVYEILSITQSMHQLFTYIWSYDGCCSLSNQETSEMLSAFKRLSFMLMNERIQSIPSSHEELLVPPNNDAHLGSSLVLHQSHPPNVD